MNKPKAILAFAALAAVSWVAVNSVGRMSSAQSAAKPLTAQDLLDIRQLIDGYSHILDNCTNNGNDYADLYTPDATFGVSSEWGKAKIWFRGREQLRRAGGGTDTACRPRESQGYAYHLTINPVDHGDADGRARDLDAADDHERHERTAATSCTGKAATRIRSRRRRAVGSSSRASTSGPRSSGRTASRTCRRASSRTSERSSRCRSSTAPAESSTVGPANTVGGAIANIRKTARAWRRRAPLRPRSPGTATTRENGAHRASARPTRTRRRAGARRVRSSSGKRGVASQSKVPE